MDAQPKKGGLGVLKGSFRPHFSSYAISQGIFFFLIFNPKMGHGNLKPRRIL
jgi:hypothetical protein